MVLLTSRLGNDGWVFFNSLRHIELNMTLIYLAEIEDLELQRVPRVLGFGLWELGRKKDIVNT